MDSVLGSGRLQKLAVAASSGRANDFSCGFNSPDDAAGSSSSVASLSVGKPEASDSGSVTMCAASSPPIAGALSSGSPCLVVCDRVCLLILNNLAVRPPGPGAAAPVLGATLVYSRLNPALRRLSRDSFPAHATPAQWCEVMHARTGPRVIPRSVREIHGIRHPPESDFRESQIPTDSVFCLS